MSLIQPAAFETCLAEGCMADRGGRPNPLCPACRGTGQHPRKDKLSRDEFVREWVMLRSLNTSQFAATIGRDIFPISCSCSDPKCRGWQMAKKRGEPLKG